MPYTKDFHFSPLGQRGGLSTYPVAGVVDGAVLSLNGSGIDGTDPTEASVIVSAGTVRFDGYPIKFAQITTTINAGVNLSTNDAVVKVYMNPVRKVSIVVGTLPNPAASPDGTFIAKAFLRDGGVYDEYYVIEQLYVTENGAWREIQPFNGNDYPRAYGWNNMPYNELGNGVLIESRPEIPVFLDSKLPPHTARPLAMFRQTASIYLGEITYSGGVATLTETMPEYHLLPL